MKQQESGFTLIEVLVAVLVFIVGIVGVSNLFLVAGSSTTAAGHNTASAAVAAEVMERLKAIPFNRFGAVGAATLGNLNADAGNTLGCDDDAQDCVAVGNYNAQKNIPGIGYVKTRWTITGNADPQILFIRVRSESNVVLLAVRSRAEFTTFRTCTNTTDNGCP